jgi:hypothetical protein
MSYFLRLTGDPGTPGKVLKNNLSYGFTMFIFGRES